MPTGRAGRLLHGDLHPGNVLLGPSGPVLIDWTDAGSGPPAHDTATSWLVLACLDRAAAAAARRRWPHDASPTRPPATPNGRASGTSPLP